MKNCVSRDNMRIEVEDPRRELLLDSKDFPITMVYKGKRYILILTKNDKLILNKYED